MGFAKGDGQRHRGPVALGMGGEGPLPASALEVPNDLASATMVVAVNVHLPPTDVRSVQDATPSAVDDGRIAMASRTCLYRNGLAQEQLLGQQFRPIVAPHALPRHRQR